MLEFIEETHTYLLDGKIIPSATQILKEIFPLKYENVPIDILNKKSGQYEKNEEDIKRSENDNYKIY